MAEVAVVETALAVAAGAVVVAAVAAAVVWVEPLEHSRDLNYFTG